MDIDGGPEPVQIESLSDDHPPYLDPDCIPPDFPYKDGPLKDLLVDPAGVEIQDPQTGISLRFCSSCSRSLQNSRRPHFVLANYMFLGMVPEELKDLTPIEESMIALCHAKCCIVQLRQLGDSDETDVPHLQRKLMGHVIIYLQPPDKVTRMLPPSVDNIVTSVCVLFIGSSPPTCEWLAKLLTACADCVHHALMWLKTHNPLYKSVELNEPVLWELGTTELLPFHVEHIQSNQVQEVLQSRYDMADSLSLDDIHNDSDSIPFEKVVIADVDVHASSNELRAAAIRHVKKKGGGYIEIPHERSPVNEFDNPHLFPMMYPTLYPYGLRGFEDRRQDPYVSFKAHIKHLFSLSDRRFQEHPSTCYNVDLFCCIPV